MALFSGRCERGPYHNRVLHHGAPTFQVVIQNGKPLTYRQSVAQKESVQVDLKFGQYRHAVDRWVWEET